MKNWHTSLIVSACIALSCGDQTSSRISSRLEALKAVSELSSSLPVRARSALLGTFYDVQLACDPMVRRIGELSDANLEAFYNAVSLVLYYTADERRVREMESVLAQLEARKLARDRHYTRMYEAYIEMRMLSQARTLAQRHKLDGLEEIPSIRDTRLVPGQPTVWVADLNRREFDHRSVDLREPAQVILVSHPSCHFSANAISVLEHDPMLAELLAEHMTVLAPQDARLEFDLLQAWNRDHPAWRTVLTVRREEWPMIDSWNTPTFYFLRRGELVAKVEGWPEGGRREEVVAALRRVGLLSNGDAGKVQRVRSD